MRCEWKDNMNLATEVNGLHIMNKHSPTLQHKLCWKCIEIKYLFNVSFRSKGYHKPKNQINETTSYWHSKPREGLEQVGAEADKNQEA